MPTTPTPAGHADRDGWVMAGMLIAAASAAVASFTGLRGLALLSGWPGRLAWLLPVTLDAYAMTSARVWLASTTGTCRARRFARANAVGAITAGIVGNAAYRSIAAGLLHISSPIVVAVGAVPAVVLGLTAHLHALRTQNEKGTRRSSKPRARGRIDGTAPGRVPRTGPVSEPEPEPALPRDLARKASRSPGPRTNC
jgi:Protein of unknown function (DUF2637)